MMARKQMNIRLDELTREAIKRIAEQYNMSESQVITRAVILLEQDLTHRVRGTDQDTREPAQPDKDTIGEDEEGIRKG